MELKPGYKKTEVGMIPEDWNVVLLGDLFSFKNGLNKGKEYFGYGMPIINYMDVYGCSGIFPENIKGRVHVNKQELKSFDVHKGDVFFTRTSETVEEIGITAVVLDEPHDTVFSGFLLRARPKNKYIDDGYKKYCFSSGVIRKAITSKSSYTTRALTNGRLLSIVPLPLPSIPEQKTIAKALSDADALIESLEQLLSKKRDIKQGAMQELLTGKKRLPGFSGEWKVKSFREICWFQEGPGVRNSQFTVSGIKLLNGTNIFRGVLDLDTTSRFISEKEAYGAYAHFLADAGDIVIASSGITIERFHDKVAFVRKANLPFCMNTSTIRFKPSVGVLSSKFLYQYLISDIFKRAIGGQATGSAQLNFGPSHIEKVTISLPSVPEQTAIATILSDMDAEIADQEAKLSKARRIKQGMMQELLTGRIRLV